MIALANAIHEIILGGEQGLAAPVYAIIHALRNRCPVILKRENTEAELPTINNLPARKRSIRMGRWVIFLLFMVMAGLLIFIFRSPLLIGLAQGWIVDENLEKSDAVVVLGGGLQSRPFKAAELYHNGFASKVLVMNVEASPTSERGLTPVEADLTRQVLKKEGVPEQAIEITFRTVSSTFEEALAVREWASSNKIEKLIIPTNLFHTRRVRWIFRRTLDKTDIRFKVIAIPERRYSYTNWWKHEDGIMAFQTELIKLCYYWLKY